MAKFIDLNCDMGESYGRWTLGADEEIMPHITSANVACGFHGGDPHVMRKTVALAVKHNVAIGSHPSLPDLIGFGRRVMDVSPAELKDYLCYQTGALREYCRAAGTELQHMKPHGILYTMIEKQHDQAWSTAIGEASKESGKELILMALASGNYDRTVRKMGVRTASEGFADRAYNADGSLTSRTERGSVIHDPDEVVRRSLRMVREGRVTAGDGSELQFHVDTLCTHGDTPGAHELTRLLREGLQREGVAVLPLTAASTPS